MATRKKFPKTIYVTWVEDGGGEPYLAVREIGNADLDTTTPCGVYDLSGEGRLTVKRDFEWRLRKAGKKS